MKKYLNEKIINKRNLLWPDLDWKFVLVHGNVRHEKEIKLIENNGVKLISLKEIFKDFHLQKKPEIKTSGGSDLVDLITFNTEASTK